MESDLPSAHADDDCLITGGSGFIGTHLLRALLASTRFGRIVVLDLVEPRLKDPRIHYFACDIRHPITCDLADYRFSACFHLAAVCKEPGYPWEEYFLTNHIGTENVCRLAERLGIDNIVFTSTMMVFKAGDQRHNEKSMTAPDTGYGMSKLLAEQLLGAWASAGTNRRLRIIRPGVVFGQGESANYTRLYNALKKRRFAYIGRRTTVKGSIYVKDLVRFLIFLVDDCHHREIYHLVYPQPTTIEDICRAMCDVFCWRRRIPVVPFRLAMLLAYGFEILNQLGLRTSIHHRRIEKLYYSTDLAADAMGEAGFELQFTLHGALDDWRKDCSPDGLS